MALKGLYRVVEKIKPSVTFFLLDTTEVEPQATCGLEIEG